MANFFSNGNMRSEEAYSGGVRSGFGHFTIKVEIFGLKKNIEIIIGRYMEILP